MVHQLLEPRVVGNNIGIHPVFTLIAMYTGFKFSGIIGLFIGPIVLIILQNVFETMIDNGIVKTILDKHENIDCNIESTKNSVIFKMKFKYN